MTSVRQTNPETPNADLLDALAPGLAALRNQRAEAKRSTQGSYAALLEPASGSEFTLIERRAVALRVAALNEAAGLAAHYREALGRLAPDSDLADAIAGGSPHSRIPGRLETLLRHAEKLTLSPHEAGPDDLAALRAHGLSVKDIVSAAQLIAFVNFQARLAAGLNLLPPESAS